MQELGKISQRALGNLAGSRVTTRNYLRAAQLEDLLLSPIPYSGLH